jgi:hypothetical protein
MGFSEQAAGVPEWHAPLVSRPQLPSGAAVRLAQFVADHLLEVLQNRQELNAAAIDAVSAEVQRRPTKPYSPGPAPISITEDDPVHAGVIQQHEAGKVLADHIYQAFDRGDRDFVASALAVRARVPLAIVAAIIKNKSAKGLTALVW